jgi:outer membrane protein TolC
LLARWCGLPADAPPTAADELTAVATPVAADSLLAVMREKSPELRVLDHQVRAAQLAVDLARAGRGPVVQLQGQYALQGQWDDGVTPGDEESAGSASVALAVSMPIFDGFATRAAVQGSEADLQRMRLEHDRVLRDRELGVRQAHLDLENALAALAGRRDAVDLASEAYRLAAVRLENGLATSLERLDAELALTEARVQLAASLYRCNLAAANLKLAVGGQSAWNDLAKETK